MALLEPETLVVRRLERRADELRAQGSLDRAREVLEELLLLAPDHLKAERLSASLSGRTPALSSTAGGLKSAPFVSVPRFLSQPLRDSIFGRILEISCEFEPARTEGGIELEARRSKYRPNFLADLDPEHRRIFEDELRTVFRAALPRLLLECFVPEHLETYALIYGSGDFFRVHRDAGGENTRRVTFIYSLHAEPKPFSGGDLLLYDTYFPRSPAVEPQCDFAATYTRLEAEDNRLVLFPSEFFHEVVPVETRREGAARIAINGWFHTTLELGAIDRILQTPY